MIKLDRVRLKEWLLQPPFEESSSGASLPSGDRDHVAAIKTYRYLRLGMVVVACALIVSILIRWSEVGCWQGSISASYYTPVRPVFVSTMVVIGVCLIIIKGSTVIEDTLLNAAGVLAPVVAFVPTSFEEECKQGVPLKKGNGSDLSSDIVGEATNNIEALLWAGGLALGIAVLISIIEHVRGELGATRYVWTRLGLLGGTAIVLLAGVWLLRTERILELHGWAALFMFGFLAVASVWNGAALIWMNWSHETTTSTHWRPLAFLYIFIGLAMGVLGCIIRYGIPEPWPHRTLVLEFVEIGLFVTMWLLQSVERWGSILLPNPAESARAPTSASA